MALPLVYVPVACFRRHGGPEAFGFTMFLPPDAPINEPSLAHGLEAELTTADLDLLRSGVDRSIGWVCGYRATVGDQFFAAWRQEALRLGYILMAAGTKELPISGPGCADRAFAVLMESAAAAVALTRTSVRSG